MPGSDFIHLVEVDAYDPTRSNRLTYTQEFDNAAWTKFQATITANATAAPDGTTTGDTLVEAATTNFHLISQYAVSFTISVPVMASVFVKPAGRTRMSIQTDSTGGSGRADYNLSTLTTAITGIATAATVAPFPFGWYRLSCIFTPSATGTLGLKLILGSTSFASSYAGDGTSGMHLWGGNLVVEPALGDYIRNDATAGPGVRTLRFASGLGKMTGAAETPASTFYAPRIMQPANFVRTMFSNARVTGGSSVGAGEIVLNNTDQGLTFLRDLGIGGRDVVVRVGAQDAAYPAGYATFLTGTAEQVEVGASRATIRLRDRLQVLQQPLQATLYAGTNSLPSGVEGVPEDIKGKPKPLLFGRRYQIQPIPVNTARLIYQFHDGAAQAVDAVYDQGVALTFGTARANQAAMEATAPAAGQYDTCLSIGMIRLGATPAGKLTMDAQGDNTGGYVNKVGEVVQRILTGRCGIAVGSLDSSSFTTLNAAATAECGAWFPDATTRQAALDAVLASVGAWLAPTRAGLWQVGQLLAPTGTPDWYFTDVEILSLDSQATRDPEAGVPIWRVKLRHKPYSPFSPAEIAGSVTAARRAELLEPWRETTASDAAVQTTHLLAGEMLRETWLNDATAAGTEATRLLALHSVRRDFVRAEVWLSATNAAVEMGQVVRLTTQRLGYTAGRDFRVVGIGMDGRRQRLSLDLWG
jgi:hypothetical protein